MAFSVAFQCFPEEYTQVRGVSTEELERKEAAELLAAGTASRCKAFLELALEAQRTGLNAEDGREVVRALVEVVDKCSDSPQLVSLCLTLLDGSVVDEKTNLDHLLRLHRQAKAPVNIITMLNRLILAGSSEVGVTAAAATHLLAAFLAELAVRQGAEDPAERINALISHLVQQAEYFLRSGRALDSSIYSLMPLFKVEAARRYFQQQDGVARV